MDYKLKKIRLGVGEVKEMQIGTGEISKSQKDSMPTVDKKAWGELLGDLCTFGNLDNHLITTHIDHHESET